MPRPTRSRFRTKKIKTNPVKKWIPRPHHQQRSRPIHKNRTTNTTSYKRKAEEIHRSSIEQQKIYCDTCNQAYSGKTKRILIHRIKEHDNEAKDSAIQTHRKEFQHTQSTQKTSKSKTEQIMIIEKRVIIHLFILLYLLIIYI